MADEIMMPVTTDEALRKAEIAAMQALGGHISALGRSLETIQAGQSDQKAELLEHRKIIYEVRDGLMRMEARDVEGKLGELRTEVREGTQRTEGQFRDRFRQIESRITNVEGQIKTFENDRAKRSGYITLLDVVYKLGPWLSLCVAIYAAFRVGQHH